MEDAVKLELLRPRLLAAVRRTAAPREIPNVFRPALDRVWAVGRLGATASRFTATGRMTRASSRRRSSTCCAKSRASVALLRVTVLRAIVLERCGTARRFYSYSSAGASPVAARALRARM